MAISGFLLRTLQQRAAAKGIELDVGEIPTYTDLDPSPSDPERPARILAHALARGADRVPLVRRLSQQVEGTDRKAGLGADLISATVDLIIRNQGAIETVLRNYQTEAVERRAAKGAVPKSPMNGAQA